jgi:hypothetical protein
MSRLLYLVEKSYEPEYDPGVFETILTTDDVNLALDEADLREKLAEDSGEEDTYFYVRVVRLND